MRDGHNEDEINVVANALSLYRLSRAREDLATSRRLLEAGDYRAANNRSYYAIFHAMRSVLALESIDSKKHSGVISEFRKRYVRNGIFSKEVSDIIGDAFFIRNASDYDDMFVASKSQTEKQIEDAQMVLDVIEKYLADHRGEIEPEGA